MKKITYTISKADLYEYYIIENHTTEECMKKFMIRSKSAFYKLTKSFEIKKDPKEKIKNSWATYEKKTGYNNPFKDPEVVDKIQQIKLDKYGDKNYNNIKKMEQTCLERYGVTNIRYYKPFIEKCHSQQVIDKCYTTKKSNNSFNTSVPEENLYKLLCKKYGDANIIRQYKDDRYPYACDFYVKSEDMFIELNLFPTHYIEPFDPTNIEHQKLLEQFKQSKKWMLNQRVNIWAGSDYDKIQLAKKNNLNYKVFYSYEAAVDFIK